MYSMGHSLFLILALSSYVMASPSTGNATVYPLFQHLKYNNYDVVVCKGDEPFHIADIR
jgi:hypothetical protein